MAHCPVGMPRALFALDQLARVILEMCCAGSAGQSVAMALISDLSSNASDRVRMLACQARNESHQQKFPGLPYILDDGVDEAVWMLRKARQTIPDKDPHLSALDAI